jgi:hypothetical protein
MTSLDAQELERLLAAKDGELAACHGELEKLRAVSDLINTAQTLASEMEKMGPGGLLGVLGQIYDGVIKGEIEVPDLGAVMKEEQPFDGLDYACKACKYDSSGVCQHPETEKLPGNVPYMAPEVRPRCIFFEEDGPDEEGFFTCARCKVRIRPDVRRMHPAFGEGSVCPDCLYELDAENAGPDEPEEDPADTGVYKWNNMFFDSDVFEGLCCNVARTVYIEARAIIEAQQKGMGEQLYMNTQLQLAIGRHKALHEDHATRLVELQKENVVLAASVDEMKKVLGINKTKKGA